MPKDSAKIRLPELPVFKKYSLALRQEFASVDEVLAVLERSTTKIREGIQRADEERRRQDQAAMPDEEELPDEGSASAEYALQESDPDDTERPFWEEPSEEDDPARSGSLSRANAAPTAKPKAKPKTRRPKPSVVRVGHHGKPIASKKPAPKKPAPKKPAPKKPAPKKPAPKKPAPKKPAPKKPAPKKPAPKKKTVNRKPVRSRAQPKSRASSRKR